MELSGSARPSQIGILCFDWLIHTVLPRNSHEVIFQATAQVKVFRLFAFFVKRPAKNKQEKFRQVSCFTCESILIVSELFTQRKCRVLTNKSASP